MKLSAYLRARVCPVCGSSDDSVVAYPARVSEEELGAFAFASRKLPEFMHLRLINCPACGLLYASPALAPDFLADAYRQAAYDSGDEAKFAARTYAEQLPSILEAIGERGMALDVGTGNGAFLQYLNDAGFRAVVGIEPSQAAVNNAEPSLRSLIRLGMFQASDFEPGSVSLFTCFQTIEHVENPQALCLDAYRLLRRDGAIFLVAHDCESWVTRIAGDRSPIFDIEHLQLFSRASLRFLLNHCGFRDIRIGTVHNKYPLRYWIKLLPMPASAKRPMMWAAGALAIRRIPIKLNVGNICAIGFKR